MSNTDKHSAQNSIPAGATKIDAERIIQDYMQLAGQPYLGARKRAALREAVARECARSKSLEV